MCLPFFIPFTRPNFSFLHSFLLAFSSFPVLSSSRVVVLFFRLLSFHLFILILPLFPVFFFFISLSLPYFLLSLFYIFYLTDFSFSSLISLLHFLRVLFSLLFMSLPFSSVYSGFFSSYSCSSSSFFLSSLISFSFPRFPFPLFYSFHQTVFLFPSLISFALSSFTASFPCSPVYSVSHSSFSSYFFSYIFFAFPPSFIGLPARSFLLIITVTGRLESHIRASSKHRLRGRCVGGKMWNYTQGGGYSVLRTEGLWRSTLRR